ncbi:MAG: VCBS repeat-containing protein, partial [Fuerstia sp.]|nr:VCBS repeat-containing protein [Fuerstiella sp.]
MTKISFFLSFLSLCLTAAGDDAFPTFEAQVIDGNVGKVCYAVTVADVDNDGDADVVALTENRVVWYEQPGWAAHVILQDQTPLDNVCIAP